MSEIDGEKLTGRIEAARENQGISLLTLAESSGIAYSTLRRKLRNPGLFNVRELTALATALNSDLEIGFAA